MLSTLVVQRKIKLTTRKWELFIKERTVIYTILYIIHVFLAENFMTNHSPEFITTFRIVCVLVGENFFLLWENFTNLEVYSIKIFQN